MIYFNLIYKGKITSLIIKKYKLLSAVLNFTFANIFPKDKTSVDSQCFQMEKVRCTRTSYTTGSTSGVFCDCGKEFFSPELPWK